MEVLNFVYDANGVLYAMTRTVDSASPDTYYYITNLQGDVMYLVDETSETVAAYAYDPYGQITFTEGNLATVNPLRYRGYYSDDETGFYYLQSRYYDPAVCRFINADSYASTGQGFAGHDAFIYCGNSPADRVDEAGTFFFTVLGAAIGGAVGFVDALITGNDPIEGAEIGAISGAIAGAGVDVGLMVAASGPVGWGVAAAAVGGVASGIVGTGMSTDWTANTVEYIGPTEKVVRSEYIQDNRAISCRSALKPCKKLRYWANKGTFFMPFCRNMQPFADRNPGPKYPQNPRF